MHLWLTTEQAKTIIAHSREQAPNEVCGIIGGRDGRALEVIPVDNVAANPTTHYELHPAQQAHAMSRLHSTGLAITALYHSHPASAPIPSQTDIQSATYPDAVYLIVGLEQDHSNLAAWQIKRGEVLRVPLHIGAEAPPHTETTLSPSQKTAIVITMVVMMVAVIAYSIYLLPPAPPIPTPAG